MTYWQMYLITRLDAVQAALCGLGLTALLGMLTLLVTIDLLSAEARRWIKPLGIAGVVCLVLSVLTPSSKEAVAIWAVPKIVNDQDTQKVVSKLPKVLDAQLEAWLRDTIKEGDDK